MEAITLIENIASRAVKKKGTIPILFFHRVLKEKDPIRPDTVDEKSFNELIRVLVKAFNVIPLSSAVKQIRSKIQYRSRRNPIVITFDDGYLDNFTIALPILKKYGAHATFFISSGFLDGGWMWNDGIIESISKTKKNTIELPSIGVGPLPIKKLEHKINIINSIIDKVKYCDPELRDEIVHAIIEELSVPEPKDLMLKSGDLIKLVESGMDIGGHTINHPILTCVTHADAKKEIQGNKKELEGIIGKRIDLFAYPNGKQKTDYNENHTLIVKEVGYDAAVTTNWGVANLKNDLFELPRLAPWDRNPNMYVLRILKYILE